MGAAWTEITPSDWTYDANIWMKDIQGGDLLAREIISHILNFG